MFFYRTRRIDPQDTLHKKKMPKCIKKVVLFDNQKRVRSLVHYWYKRERQAKKTEFIMKLALFSSSDAGLLAAELRCNKYAERRNEGLCAGGLPV